jgi:hypothetical protein
MFAVMQEETRLAIRNGIVPHHTLRKGLDGGLIGKEFIDDVVKAV